jgi:hypothetical protein
VTFRSLVWLTDPDRGEPTTPKPVQRRKSAGDPKCDYCLWSPRGACSAHLDYHAPVDVLKSAGTGALTHAQRVERTWFEAF